MQCSSGNQGIAVCGQAQGLARTQQINFTLEQIQVLVLGIHVLHHIAAGYEPGDTRRAMHRTAGAADQAEALKTARVLLIMVEHANCDSSYLPT